MSKRKTAAKVTRMQTKFLFKFIYQVRVLVFFDFLQSCLAIGRYLQRVGAEIHRGSGELECGKSKGVSLVTTNLGIKTLTLYETIIFDSSLEELSAVC